MEKYEYIISINKQMVKNKLPERKKYFHKGNFGKLLTLCGSKLMYGAAYFSICGALRSGVGLVKACVTNSVYKKLNVYEPTFCILDEDNQGFVSKNSLNDILKMIKICSAAVIGPGLGQTEDVKNIIYEVIKNSDIPLIIDADGINAISQNIDILKDFKCKIILTPHTGEMSRLIGVSSEEISKNKVKYASEFAKKHKIILVLKGHNTVISDENGNIFLNSSGNVGMAKGGSGDVLAGIIGSLAAQKISLLDAAICGVFIHGLAGDYCKEKYSSVSMIPSDIINNLADVFLEFEI